MDVEKEIHRLERLILAKQYEASVHQLIILLSAVSTTRTQYDRIFNCLNDAEKQYVALRLSSAVFQLFQDRSFQLSDAGFLALAKYGCAFHTVLSSTDFNSADHVIRHLLGQDERGESQADVDVNTFKKILFLWSIYSDVELPFEDYMAEFSALCFYPIVNALTMKCYAARPVHMRRERLLEKIADGAIDLELSDETMPLLGPLWMYTTYATTDKKHSAKVSLNTAYKKWMARKGLKLPTLPKNRKIKDKPNLIVIMEQMSRNHAMFRCFGESLKYLSESFNLIGMGVEGCIDEDVFDVFAKVILFPKEISAFKKYVGAVLKTDPDIILYLSLGMQNSTIPLANLRLAPIQMMFLAHPAPSKIDTMDYVVIEEGLIKQPEEYTEKMIWMKSGDFVLRDTIAVDNILERAKARRGEHQNIVKIAIPSFALKISDPFVSVLERIQQITEKDIEYHFFPFLTDMNLVLFKRQILDRLPGSKVHQPMPYDEYLEILGHCDMHLGSFPFNNSNGNIDSVKMQLPMVVLEQDATEGAVDAMMLRHMEAPEEAITSDIEEYIELAVALVEDLEYREELQSKFEKIDLNETYFNIKKSTSIVNAIKSVYFHHEEIQQKNIKIIKVNELDTDSCQLIEATN